MKFRTQFLVLALFAVAIFLHAQGRGKLIKMERNEIIKIASGLKKGMTQAEVVQFMTSRGLEEDWGAFGDRPTNLIEMWYLYGSSYAHTENLRLLLYSKEAMSLDRWKKEHYTNSSLVSADIYITYTNGGKFGGAFIPIQLTNSP